MDGVEWKWRGEWGGGGGVGKVGQVRAAWGGKQAVMNVEDETVTTS